MKCYLPPITGLFFLLVIVSPFVSTGQSVQKRPDYDAWADFFRKNPAEKLYLHTDRDLYAINDTIWLKAYLVNAHTSIPDQALLRNVYVELVNAEKQVVARNMLAMKKGTSFGDFNLASYSLAQGKYQLRGYTGFQTNFGSELIFEKSLLLVPAFEKLNSVQYFDSLKTVESKAISSQPAIDLQFMPEGGQLTLGINNVMAFKALNIRGRGIEVTGKLYNQSGDSVASFASEYLGMGKLVFKPEAGKTYYAALDADPKVHYPLPQADNRLQMCVSDGDSVFTVRLKSNTLEVKPAWYHLVVTSRGFVCYYTKVLMNAAYKSVKIPHRELTGGINQITLMDSSLVPFRDRLVFVDKNEQIKLDISTSQASYQPFDSVEVVISARQPDQTPARVLLSVAVTDEIVPHSLETGQQTISSYLLIDSDLKGQIEHPGNYFNSGNSKARQQLDLLLLTQGWSSYNWNPLLASQPEVKTKKQSGIELRGKVSNPSIDTKSKKCTVALSLEQDGELYYQTVKTDEEGQFVLVNLVIPDSTTAYFSCPDEQDKKREFSVSTFIPEIPVAHFDDFLLPDGRDISLLSHQAFTRFVEDKAYHPEKYEILMDEIVVNKKIETKDIKDDHFRPYSKVDRAFVPTPNDESYVNVLYYLSRELGRVNYDGTSVQISGKKESPMFMLDGMEVELYDIEGLPMETVDKVEVIYEPVSLAMWSFDSQAAKGGIISVFTKRGGTDKTDELEQMKKVLRGYYPSRKFYSPRYQANKVPEKNDLRTTLLWAPVVNTDENGIARFVFFNNDRRSVKNIRVEGISIDGKPAFGEKQYTVE